MRETIELRIPEEHARRFLKPNEGVRLNIVRKLELAPSDPRLQELRAIYQQLLSEGHFLFTAWIPHRRYSAKELEAAEILRVKVKTAFELSDDEYGTLYDESTSCSHCGAGAKQVSELALNTARIPKNRDVAVTLSGEVVVSHRFWEVMGEHRLTGLELRLVRNLGRGNHGRSPWYQLAVKSRPVEISEGTRIGIDPFDADPEGRYRCPKGHVAGLNLLSELSVVRSSYDRRDFFETRQLVGNRRGLLMPEPVRIVSERAFQVLRRQKLTGIEFEVARLV